MINDFQQNDENSKRLSITKPLVTSWLLALRGSYDGVIRSGAKIGADRGKPGHSYHQYHQTVFVLALHLADRIDHQVVATVYSY